MLYCFHSIKTGLGSLVVSLRGSIFLPVKESILRGALSATATRASKAEDEYDYPAELQLISVNRPRAALGTAFSDPDARYMLVQY